MKWLDRLLPSNSENDVYKIAFNPRSQLDSDLNYYVSLNRPLYAILITGAWGTGKTFQVRRALPDTHAFYISLFGLNTIREVEEQVFARMFPNKASFRNFSSKIDSINLKTGFANIGTGGLAGVLSGVIIKNNVDSRKPIIFDDLERSNIKLKCILGLINRYVEHHGCRVIVIAHDEKIVGNFTEAKEKIFGRTISVQPNTHAAYRKFIDDIVWSKDLEASEYPYRECVKIFNESGNQSLRVLRHTIEDLSRLIEIVPKEYLSNKPAMVEMSRLFSAISIEYRMGKISKEDIKNRSKYAHKFQSDKGSGTEIIHYFRELKDKYSTTKIDSNTINDRTLHETVVDGIFLQKSISDSLRESTYFADMTNYPSWRILLNFETLSDEIVSAAQADVNRMLTNFEITEIGVFLHIIALRMMTSFRGASNDEIAEIVKFASLYIKELKNRRLLAERNPSSAIDDISDSFGGFAYWVHDEYRGDFISVVKEIIKIQNSVYEENIEEKIRRLLNIMMESGEKFFEQVCYSNNSEPEFVDFPILSYIAPSEFVDAWLSSPRGGWYWIGSALNRRMRSISNESPLMKEAEWYKQTFDDLIRRADDEEGLSKVRLYRTAARIGFSIPT